MKKASLIIAIILVLILIGGIITGMVLKATQKIENPVATIKFQGYDQEVVLELYPEYAENTVINFIALANNGFYKGLKIHRVEDSLIQGGDKNGDGTGSPKISAIDKSIEADSENDKEYAIPGEFINNGYKQNTLRFERGVIGMARSDWTQYASSLESQSNNSAGSQFFILTETLSSLNGEYTAFGKVISGMETIDSISKVETAVDENKNEETGEVTKTETTRPATDVIIESITIDTKGVEYGMPETNELFDFTSWYINKYYGSSLLTEDTQNNEN